MSQRQVVLLLVINLVLVAFNLYFVIASPPAISNLLVASLCAFTAGVCFRWATE